MQDGVACSLAAYHRRVGTGIADRMDMEPCLSCAVRHAEACLADVVLHAEAYPADVVLHVEACPADVVLHVEACPADVVLHAEACQVDVVVSETTSPVDAMHHVAPLHFVMILTLVLIASAPPNFAH